MENEIAHESAENEIVPAKTENNKICMICNEDTCVSVVELLNAISKLGSKDVPSEVQGNKKAE